MLSQLVVLVDVRDGGDHHHVLQAVCPVTPDVCCVSSNLNLACMKRSSAGYTVLTVILPSVMRTGSDVFNSTVRSKLSTL